MTGARTAVALYVALALHAVALLFLLLAPLPQTGAGSGIGLSLAGTGSVLAAPGVPSVQPARKAPRAPRSTAAITQPARASTRVPTPAPERDVVAMPRAAQTELPTEPGSSLPARVGSGETAGNAGGGGIDTYFSQLRAHLAAFRRDVPDAATGRAEVRFTVLADGRVAGLVLERSSGSGRLDSEALALVARAQPLPLPPRGEALRVRVPIYVGG